MLRDVAATVWDAALLDATAESDFAVRVSDILNLPVPVLPTTSPDVGAGEGSRI